MQKITSTLALLLILLLLVSCIKKPEVMAQSDEAITFDIESLELNKGQKWVVTFEMKPYIMESESLIEEFIINKSIDYKELVSQLRDRKSDLVTNCNMQCRGHDELHKWLVPYIYLIEELDDSNDSEKSKKIVLELKRAFEVYHQYFQ